MKTEIVKLNPAAPDAEKISEAAAVVDAGGLVAFPTETVYGIACRAKSDSLARLDELKGRASEKRYTLHISEKADVHKYLPAIGIRTQKLIDNAWPGPLTIVFELDEAGIEKQAEQMETEAFENLYRDNTIGIRCPDNAVASMLLGQVKNAVVAPSANPANVQPATDAGQVVAALSGQVDMVLDAGACKYKTNSTVISICSKELKILREGAYSQEQVESMSTVRFLFVCSGNSCRSPMAEGIFRKYLAEKLGCEVDRLDQIGYKVSSAGTIGIVGLPASQEAVVACGARGIDIRAHSSRALTEQVLRESDFIFAMSRGHLEHIIALGWPAAGKCTLLAGGEQIADPIGQSQQVYDACAEMIEDAVKKRISELII